MALPAVSPVSFLVYREAVSTMAAPSPYLSRDVGDPQVPPSSCSPPLGPPYVVSRSLGVGVREVLTEFTYAPASLTIQASVSVLPANQYCDSPD